MRLCVCGSGLPSEEVKDARGIYLARVCRKCRAERLAGFRPEVLNDSGYECDEAIEEEV